ncbi:MAG: NAD(P)/FAD-dependent oxidoreductase [Thermoleophilaceae bacterium]
MADHHVDHLLIGAGVASAACARSLRERGAKGSIAIVGRELDPPYHRPPITKGYLRGSESKQDTHALEPSWYGGNDVELRTRAGVRSLDTEAKTAKLQGGEELSFSSALLATGSLVNRLRIDGSDLDGLHYVRALGNADAIRGDAESAEGVVIVGGSYIGCEVAASLTDMGKRCTIVMLEDEPMERGFGSGVGRWVREQLEGRGVQLAGGEQVERFEGSGRVERVVTRSGEAIDADMVVLGTGVTPDVMVARAAGLVLGESGGVLCDSRLETSAPDVYAARDICEYDSTVHGRRLRVEHEDVAERQGESVAGAMLGSTDAHTAVPYFWTDLSNGAMIESVGPASSWDDEVVRGSMQEGRFSVLYLDGGRLVACAAVDRAEDLERARQAIQDGGRLPADWA